MKRKDQGYALIISMIALVLLTTLTGVMALSTGGDVKEFQHNANGTADVLRG